MNNQMKLKQAKEESISERQPTAGARAVTQLTDSIRRMANDKEHSREFERVLPFMRQALAELRRTVGEKHRFQHELAAANGKAGPPGPLGNEPGLAILTNRERDVLRLIASGYATKNIAEEFGVAFKTAVTHRTHLMAKLRLHDTASLTRYAIRHGLVQP